MFDAVKVKNDCIQWIRNWFENNGKDCNAVIGISGGKDSSVVAALCVEALGKDRVIGVLMPNGEQTDIDMSYKLVNHLGLILCELERLHHLLCLHFGNILRGKLRTVGALTSTVGHLGICRTNNHCCQNDC